MLKCIGGGTGGKCWGVGIGGGAGNEGAIPAAKGIGGGGSPFMISIVVGLL